LEGLQQSEAGDRIPGFCFSPGWQEKIMPEWHWFVIEDAFNIGLMDRGSFALYVHGGLSEILGYPARQSGVFTPKGVDTAFHLYEVDFSSTSASGVPLSGTRLAIHQIINESGRCYAVAVAPNIGAVSSCVYWAQEDYQDWQEELRGKAEFLTTGERGSAVFHVFSDEYGCASILGDVEVLATSDTIEITLPKEGRIPFTYCYSSTYREYVNEYVATPQGVFRVK